MAALASASGVCHCMSPFFLFLLVSLFGPCFKYACIIPALVLHGCFLSKNHGGVPHGDNFISLKEKGEHKYREILTREKRGRQTKLTTLYYYSGKKKGGNWDENHRASSQRHANILSSSLSL